ncbi:MATE family efflux transporter [Paenibacillus chartarius]|uniref:Probable multidrug resistance protein NorM n=1 Tax=Paenibacillus chartarius TaxID=747481 RepID=A0ABV6DPB6_9BACL
MFNRWMQIMKLALPSIVSFASATVTGTISLLLVGQLGALVIAIVGVSNIIMYNAWALSSGIGHTVNYLVAQSAGAGEWRKAIERTYLASYLCIGLGLLVAAAGTFAPEALLHLMGGSPELVEAGKGYLQLRFYAMVFTIGSFVLQGFFRGIGDTRTPMIMSFISNIGMIVLTYGLTYGHLGLPELGLAGAGIAFLIGELAALVWGLYVFFIRLHPRLHTRARIPFNLPEFKLIAGESGKLALNEFAMSMAMFVFTAFVTRLGTAALAANEVSLNVMALGFMPAFGFGATATILVGQEIGKGLNQAARRIGTDTALIGSILLLLLGVAEFIWAEPIARLYSSDPEVYRLAADLIRISAFLQLFDGLFNFYAGGLRGIGDTTFLLVTSISLNWLLFLPLAYVLIFMLGYSSYGAWIALYTFIFALGCAVLIRYYFRDWTSIRAKQAQQAEPVH